MIRTDIDIKDYLYGWISGSELADEIDGNIYKDERPNKSTKEDLCITVIARDARQMQDSIVNVNIYVRDVRRANEMIEDTPRLRALCTLSARILEYRNDGYALTELMSQEVMKVEGIDFHCINNQLRVRFNNE